VSIARAFVNNPQVIFADEPTGNLDTKTTFEMMDMITGIARERNQTLIIVTHDTEISQYADCVISIRDGNVESITENEAVLGPGMEPVTKENEETAQAGNEEDINEKD